MFGIWFGVCVCCLPCETVGDVQMLLSFFVMDKRYFRNLQLIENMSLEFHANICCFFVHMCRPILISHKFPPRNPTDNQISR